MILIGDRLVPSEKLFKIENIEDIVKTEANATLLYKYDENLLSYCFKNELASAVIVSNIKECIYSNAMSVKYIICDKSLALSLQKIADNYMFDARILQIITTSNEIENVALDEIDGAIYQELL